MKKLLILLSIVLQVGCTSNSKPINEKSSNRIKLIEYRIINGHAYIIIEVDKIQYLTQNQGGFVKL